jgi:hypothetical protein
MKTLLVLVAGVGLIVSSGFRVVATGRRTGAAGARANDPLNSGHLIYHERDRRLLMVGGNQPPAVPELLELRTWRSPAWALLPAAAGPSMRTLDAVIYDSRRQRVVVYGGLGRKGLDDPRADTWEWDGQRWFEMPDTSVGTRDHHTMAYDEARGRSVLFGGLTSIETPTGYTRASPAETIEWDGRKWTKLEVPGPGARGGAEMVYDRARKQIVLFGGLGSGTLRLGDTWTWDGSAWRAVSGEGPPGRNGHAMVFDRKAGVVLMWGGTTGAEHLDDLWQWDGRSWKEIQVTGPRPGKRTGAGMVYDMHRERVVLYGGRIREDGRVKDSDEMWEWDGHQWTLIAHARNDPPL